VVGIGCRDLFADHKLNGLNPQHYLVDVLARIAELLPWNWLPLDATGAAA
jgi:hypothetical protein